MRVLIVDHHEPARRSIRSLLSGANGIEVCGEAVDGMDAITKAEALQPDLITMEISMPKMNGLEAMRRIRRILPQLPVVIITQDDSSKMRKRAMNAGADAYLMKSAISSDLKAALQEIPRFDIFRGFHSKNAVWIERVVGLAAARERMEQIAAEHPDPYFVFSPASHAVLAKHVALSSEVLPTDGYNIFRKLDNGEILKIGWWRDQDQAKQLITSLVALWPAEYFIEPANAAPGSASQAPAASA